MKRRLQLSAECLLCVRPYRYCISRMLSVASDRNSNWPKHKNKFIGSTIQLGRSICLRQGCIQALKKCHLDSFLGLPWWRSGWESACQCRGHGFEPWSGRSHVPWSNWAPAPQLLTLRSGAHEPQALSRCATTAEARAPGACALRQERPPLPAAGGGLRAAMKTQCSQK